MNFSETGDLFVPIQLGCGGTSLRHVLNALLNRDEAELLQLIDDLATRACTMLDVQRLGLAPVSSLDGVHDCPMLSVRRLEILPKPYARGPRPMPLIPQRVR